ncbi:hypothetical protein GGF31_004088 [Allomyces arbusculus]|nr:hypothetical protein GGF31_004088 [Allomyces arbusculus]
MSRFVVPAIVNKQRIAHLRESDTINEYNTTATLYLTRYAADPAHAAALVKYLLKFERRQVFTLAAGTDSVIAFPSWPAVSSKLPYRLKVLSHATSQIPVLHVLDLPESITAMRKADAAHALQLVKDKWVRQPQSLQEINAVKAELHLVHDQLCVSATSKPKVPLLPTVVSLLVLIPKACGFAGHVYNEGLLDLLKSTMKVLKVTVATAHLGGAQPLVLRLTDNVTTLKLELRGDKRALDKVVTALDKMRSSFSIKIPRVTAEYYDKPVWVVTTVVDNGGEPAGPAVAAI